MDFVSYSLNYWEDLWQSRHQIMLALAQRHKVLFVSPPFSLREVLGHLRQNDLPRSGVVYRGANLNTLVFPKWLFENYRFPKLDKVATSLRQRHVRRAMKRYELRNTVLFIWHPQYAGLVGTIGEALSCYYVDDEFADYAGASEAERQRLLEQEDMLLRRADVVFANGPALLKAKNRYGNAINVPMAADFELFSRSRLAETLVPPDLEAIPHPRVGYVGNLNDKVDFALLGRLSAERPSWSFVLVGPSGVRSTASRSDLDFLTTLPNVFLLGAKSRESLPNYIKGFDVCIMCYRKQGWANYIYPLKLHEYLASGKPVVGTGIASLCDFSEVVRLADTEQEWLEALEGAIVDHDRTRSERRIQVAYENRLESRVAIIEQALEQKMNEKGLRSR